MATSGSIRKTNIGGIPYNVAADANAALTPRITKEGVPHSGGNMIKITKAMGNLESLTLIVTDTEYDTLQDQAGGLESIPLSFTKADGSSWVCQGHINLDNYESEENRVDVTMIPELGIWDLFAA